MLLHDETIILKPPPSGEWPVRGFDAHGGIVLVDGFRAALAMANGIDVSALTDALMTRSLVLWYLARRLAGHPPDMVGECLLRRHGIDVLFLTPPESRH